MPDETSPLLSLQSSQDINENGPDHATRTAAEDLSHTQDSPSMSFITLVLPMSIGVFLAAMDGTIVISSYAAIGSELKQLQSMSWIATAYMMTATSFQPLSGKLSDVFGRKECLLSAYLIFAIGSLGSGLSRTMNELIASRALAGVGGGAIQTISSIVLSDVIPLRSRGTWQGILSFIFTLGSASGAPLSGFLTDTIGWRWIFLFQVPLAVLAITSAFLSLHLPKQDTSDFYKKLKRVDFAGSVTLILAVFLLLLGVDRGGNIAWRDKLTLLSLCGSFVFSLVFGVVELRMAKEPFAPQRIVCNRSLIAAYLTHFFGMAAAVSTTFHVSLYLQVVQGKTPSEVGVWLIFVAVGIFVGTLSGGLIIQATGKYYVLTIISFGMLFLGILVVGLSMKLALHSIILLCTGMLISNLGAGSGMTSSLIALIANAGKGDQAIATAVSYLFRSLGTVIGVSIGSSLIQETLRSYLRRNLSGHDIEAIILRVRESLSYLDQLDPGSRTIVTNGYAKAIQIALAFTAAMGAGSFISTFFIKATALTHS